MTIDSPTMAETPAFGAESRGQPDHAFLPRHGMKRLAFFLVPPLLAFLCLLHLHYFPSGGDATGYYILTDVARKLGFLRDLGGIRTYGYPAFLYPLSFLSTLDIPWFTSVIGAVQYALYFALSLLLVRQAARLSGPWRNALYAGLLLNPLALTLVTDILTESITLCLALAMAVLLLAIRAWPERGLLWRWLGAGLAAYALVVRPANAILFLCWHLAAVFPPLMAAARREKDGVRTLLLYLSGMAGITALIFAPQLYYNVVHWQKLTLFPVCRIDQLQYALGAFVAKYETDMGAGGATGAMYINPFASGKLPSPAWHWYFEHPLAGLPSMLLHLFNVFDFTTPFTYIYAGPRWYRYPLGALVWALLLLGLWRFVPLLWRARRWAWRPERRDDAAILLFLGALFGLTTAMNSVIQVENRFAILPALMLMTAGLATLFETPRRIWRALPLMALVLAVGGCLALSTVMERYRVTAMPKEFWDLNADQLDPNRVNTCYFLLSDIPKPAIP